ncbi:matrix [La Joya virus]|uniref:Matrix n=1 Tax=La Joya virus TaxID=1272946 RepID=A0A0D3R137_9RHAB|nr:matrix [La Joya virus]AJR28301.1 matrix [La Joya virus]
MLTLWKKKKAGPPSEGEPSSGIYDWAYGADDRQLDIFNPTAPHVEDKNVLKCHATIEIRFLTKLEINSIDMLCHVLERIVEGYKGDFNLKPVHESNLLLVGTHMYRKLDREGTYEYKGQWDDIIVYDDIYAELKSVSSKYSQSFKFKIRGMDIAGVFHSSLRASSRSGKSYYDIYRLPMSNGQVPPLLAWLKSELGL